MHLVYAILLCLSVREMYYFCWCIFMLKKITNGSDLVELKRSKHILIKSNQKLNATNQFGRPILILFGLQLQ